MTTTQHGVVRGAFLSGKNEPKTLLYYSQEEGETKACFPSFCLDADTGAV